MRRQLILVLVALGGAGVALAAGIATARSYTLEVAQGAAVTNQKHLTTSESIVVDSHGYAVYTLSGETTAHPKCTSSACLGFWPPVKVSGKLSAAPGVKGKLGVWRRDGFRQLTLGGHPLYTFSLDKHKHAAGGEGVVGFGGTWHVVEVASAGGATKTSGSTSTATTTTGTYSYPTTSSPTTTIPYY